MKKLLIIIALTTMSLSVQAQKEYKPLSSFMGDTLAFLRYNFGENKSRYIGQKFEKILKDYGMPIKDVSCKYWHKDNDYGKNYVFHTGLYYISDVEIDKRVYKKIEFIGLKVIFSPPLYLPKHPRFLESEPHSNTAVDRDFDRVARKMKDGIVSDVILLE